MRPRYIALAIIFLAIFIVQIDSAEAATYQSGDDIWAWGDVGCAGMNTTINNWTAFAYDGVETVVLGNLTINGTVELNCTVWMNSTASDNKMLNVTYGGDLTVTGQKISSLNSLEGFSMVFMPTSSAAIDHAIIENMYNYGTFDGLVIHDSDVVIANTIIRNGGGAGVDVSTAPNTVLDNNTIYNNGYGVFVSYSNHTQIKNCNVSYNTNIGLDIQDSWHTNSSDNYVQNSGAAGILFSDGWHNHIMYNTVTDSGSHGLSFAGGADKQNATIIGNFIQNSLNDGLYMWNNENSTIKDNTFYNNTRYGLYTYAEQYGEIDNNNISHNGEGVGDYGVLLIGAWGIPALDIDFTNNEIHDNFYGGLYLSHVNDTNFEYNRIYDNLREGIHTGAASNCTFTGDYLNDNSYWEFFINNWFMPNNDITNMTIGDVNVSFTTYAVSLEEATAPAGNPAGNESIGKFLNMTNNTAVSWIDLDMFYVHADLGQADEPTLRILEYDTTWSEVTGSGVDIGNNYVYANLTSFSIFAPMGSRVASAGGSGSSVGATTGGAGNGSGIVEEVLYQDEYCWWCWILVIIAIYILYRVVKKK